MDKKEKGKEEKKMATVELKSAELNLDTFDKFKRFVEYANNPNPANDKIRRMIKESPPIPRRKK